MSETRKPVADMTLEDCFEEQPGISITPSAFQNYPADSEWGQPSYFAAVAGVVCSAKGPAVNAARDLIGAIRDE